MDREDGFDPASIEVFVGVDMAKGDHYAQAITAAGDELFDRPVANDEPALRQLIADATRDGCVAVLLLSPIAWLIGRGETTRSRRCRSLFTGRMEAGASGVDREPPVSVATQSEAGSCSQRDARGAFIQA